MDKLKKRLYLVAISPLLSLCFLSIWLLRPFLIIRFKLFRTDSIGHLAGEPDIYLCDKAWETTLRKKTLDIFYYNIENYQHYICNHQLLNMLKRKMHVLNLGQFTAHLHYFTKFLPNNSFHQCNWPATTALTDKKLLVSKTPPQIAFTKRENRRGEETLEKLGIKSGAPLVCFFNRDKAYTRPLIETVYHDYRNSKIENYLPAAQGLTQQGFTLIRMGKTVEQPLSTSNKKIIDYANSEYRSDFMDIFLMSRCSFVLGAVTGLGHVGTMFRKPIALVNSVPLLTFYRNSSYDPNFINNIIIFKKYWSNKKNRFLTLKEMMENGSYNFYEKEEYEKYGIEIQENTPEEIKDIALEMQLKLDGNWQETEEDVILQKKFWSAVGQSTLGPFSIGALFLRKNKWLFD